MSKQKIICIVGPTGSGKSSTAVKLAKAIDGEIISADSMQIYKDMNIGTAKITKEEIQGVEHYLIDVVDPIQNFSVSDWKDCAEKAITQIASKGKMPIIAGGTGLYVNALINNFKFYSVDESKRNYFIAKYNEYLKNFGVDALYQKLLDRVPDFAKKVDKNKTRAIINYLALLDAGATNLDVCDRESEYDYLLIGLNIDRELIYSKINTRVDEMVDDGLLDEIEFLKNKYGFNENCQSASAIGYREFWEYFNGNITKDRAIELVKQHSRNYAKRQFTYIKKMRGLVWFEYNDFDGILKEVKDFLGTKGEC